MFSSTTRSIWCVSLATLVLVLMSDVVRAQSDSWREQERALRSDGLHAAAKVTGSFVGSADFHSEQVASGLAALIRMSSAIVVGEITDSRCRLTADGKRITTDYSVTVLETLKGSITVGDSIIVSIPGGKVEFGDGTWAELLAADYRLPQLGERYVMILEPSRLNPSPAVQASAGINGVFSTVYGSQGLFALTPDLLRVRPRGRRTDPVVVKYWEKDFGRFMLDLRADVAAVRAAQ